MPAVSRLLPDKPSLAFPLARNQAASWIVEPQTLPADRKIRKTQNVAIITLNRKAMTRPTIKDVSRMDIFLHKVVESAGALALEVLLFTPRPGQSEMDAYKDGPKSP